MKKLNRKKRTLQGKRIEHTHTQIHNASNVSTVDRFYGYINIFGFKNFCSQALKILQSTAASTFEEHAEWGANSSFPDRSV